MNIEEVTLSIMMVLQMLIVVRELKLQKQKQINNLFFNKHTLLNRV